MTDSTAPKTSRLTRGQRAFVLALIILATLWAWSPFLGVVVAGIIADYGGCVGNEGGVHPCVIGGHDYGQYIYRLTVGGWMMLVTWPFMLASIPVWIVIIIRWRRGRTKTS
jgi:MFS family permease